MDPLFRPQILENRLYLITIIGIVTTAAALSPFFLGTVFSFELLLHDLIHISAIILGSFLTILSIYAYISTKNRSLIFTSFAFLTFVLLSVFMLLEDLAQAQLDTEHCDIIEYPCVHHTPSQILIETILTIMVGFFAVGVFWGNKMARKFV